MNHNGPLLILALATFAACKFPYPPDLSSDGQTATDALSDGPPALAPMIAFTSDRAGNNDIFTMRTDGTMVQNLTHNVASDSSPAWSPAGDRIAFLSNRTGTRELYVMSADGNAPLNVSRGEANGPAWAPDGSKLAFYSNRSGSYQISGDARRRSPGPADDHWRQRAFVVARRREDCVVGDRRPLCDERQRHQLRASDVRDGLFTDLESRGNRYRILSPHHVR